MRLTLAVDDLLADLAAIARVSRVRVSEGDLRALAPAIASVWAGVERFKELPIGEREPAFRPSVRGDTWTGEQA